MMRFGNKYTITAFKTKDTIKDNLARVKPENLNQKTENASMKFFVSVTQPMLVSLNAGKGQPKHRKKLSPK